ncbi:unnamed protein product [Ectocarpus sp. 12 AP-2014]
MQGQFSTRKGREINGLRCPVESIALYEPSVLLDHPTHANVGVTRVCVWLPGDVCTYRECQAWQGRVEAAVLRHSALLAGCALNGNCASGIIIPKTDRLSWLDCSTTKRDRPRRAMKSLDDTFFKTTLLGLSALNLHPVVEQSSHERRSRACVTSRTLTAASVCFHYG